MGVVACRVLAALLAVLTNSSVAQAAALDAGVVPALLKVVGAGTLLGSKAVVRPCVPCCAESSALRSCDLLLGQSGRTCAAGLQVKQSQGNHGNDRTTTALDALTALLRGEDNSGNPRAQQVWSHRMRTCILSGPSGGCHHCAKININTGASMRCKQQRHK
jgi:hypothetical protein